jgi:hypothetical protein
MKLSSWKGPLQYRERSDRLPTLKLTIPRPVVALAVKTTSCETIMLSRFRNDF